MTIITEHGRNRATRARDWEFEIRLPPAVSPLRTIANGHTRGLARFGLTMSTLVRISGEVAREIRSDLARYSGMMSPG